MKTRQFVAVIYGCILIYRIWQSKYNSDIVDAFIWIGLLLFGFIFFIVVLIKDYNRYREEKTWHSFATIFTLLGFVLIAIALDFKVCYDINKPSLVNVMYDGDINSAALDLKKDGTYVFINSSWGGSNYIYGTYTINGNKINLDKSNLDNVVLTPHLEIKDIDTIPYLVQLKNGAIINYELQFKVIADNR